MKRAWRAFQAKPGITAIQTRKQYEQTIALMNRLLDEVGNDERHPLAGVLDLVGRQAKALAARRHFPGGIHLNP